MNRDLFFSSEYKRNPVGILQQKNGILEITDTLENWIQPSDFSLILSVYNILSRVTVVRLVLLWLNCCTEAKTVFMTQGSVPGSRRRVDSAFPPFEVGKISGGWQYVPCIIKL